MPITVGNVFAPTGRGCIGGWSLVLVHTLDDAALRHRSAGRSSCTTGHVRQGQNDGPNNGPSSGFRVSGAPARLGVTAYEGDSGNVGAVLRVNGTAVADPSTGSTTNFFNSSADNELDPAYANNFSVDSKACSTRPPDLIPRPGDTAAEIETSTPATPTCCSRWCCRCRCPPSAWKVGLARRPRCRATR